MKRITIFLAMVVAAVVVQAQTLDRMQWFNEPEAWSIKNNELTMQVTPQSDYWRISHYSFTVDDAPFLYTTCGGEFEVKVKISGDYKVSFDQAGLMLRADKENYIKAGIEFVEDKNYTMMRNCHLADNTSVMVGMMAACPDGKGFEARFEEFKITHLPDLRRLEWLKKNQ